MKTEILFSRGTLRKDLLVYETYSSPDYKKCKKTSRRPIPYSFGLKIVTYFHDNSYHEQVLNQGPKRLSLLEF